MKKVKTLQDFWFFALIILLFLFCFAALLSVRKYNAFVEERQIKFVEEGEKVSQVFKYALSYVASFMNFMGEKIIYENNVIPEKIAPILKIKGSDQNDFFTWTLYDFVTPEGLVIVSSSHGVIDNPKTVKKEQRRWMVEGKEKPWRLITSWVDTGIISGEKILPVGMGIEREGKEFLGYISTGLNVSKLTRNIEKVTNGYRGINSGNIEFLIIDQDYIPVLSSGVQDISPRDIDRLEIENFLQGNKEAIKIGGYNYYLIKEIKDYPFLLLVGENRKIATAQFQKSLLPIILNIFLLGIFFIIVLYLFRRYVISPVVGLVSAAEQISQGKDIGKISSGRSYEASKLAEQLNKVKGLIVEEKEAKYELAKAMEMVRESHGARERYRREIRSAMRSPLISAQGALEVLMGAAMPGSDVSLSKEQELEFLKKSYNSVLHVSALTTEILDLTYFDIKESIKEAVDIHKNDAYAMNIAVETSFSKDIPSFYGDRLRFVQIVSSLVQRSINFLPKNKTIFINVEALPVEDKKKKYLHITIKDNGFGLNNDNTRKLFKSNDLLEILHETDFNETAIEKLVALHSGKIKYDDILNEGSIVTIKLPYKKPTSGQKPSNVVDLFDLKK